MNIYEIAENLNKLASNYEIGNLHSIRQKLKKMSNKAGSKIFRNNTIFDEGWAFHYGGRKELQFNIGFENEGLRYGIAFSLETSRSLPKIDLLYPKILKLNSMIINQSELFIDYKMWYWQNKDRSEIRDVFQIDEQLTKNGTFIFIGKIIDKNSLDFDEILKTFDRLLKVYIEVENDNQISLSQGSLTKNDEFIFVKGKTNLPQNTSYTKTQKQININARHSFLQEQLYTSLVSVFGPNNVGTENFIGGKRIDVVLKTNSTLTFYEVKACSSAKQCMREALGQLMEYAYFNGKRYAGKIVIAGEHPIDIETKEYLKFLNSEFNLPLDYHQIKI